MNSVNPITDTEMIKDIMEYLREKSDRNVLLFLYGIYLGFRISDMLPMRVRDVKGKKEIKVKEAKTKKEREIPIHPVLQREIAKYVKDKKDWEFLFKSRKGKNTHICRQQAYRVLNDAGKQFGMDLIGTHTMRKTFGYHLYQQTHDINLVQSILGHSTPEVTKRYIGITKEKMYDAIRNLNY